MADENYTSKEVMNPFTNSLGGVSALTASSPPSSRGSAPT
jgi:hypothetical protein